MGNTNEPYNFNNDCINSHNTLRGIHGCPPLRWSTELESHAQDWANNLATRDIVDHDREGLQTYQEGENIAWFTGTLTKCTTEVKDDCITCKEAVQSWYDEIINYDFGKGDAKSPGTPFLHFTQVCLLEWQSLRYSREYTGS